VGLKDNNPYEVFCGKSDLGGPQDVKIDHGTVDKIKNGHYTLYNNGKVVSENISELCEDDEEALARLISISLQGGIHIKDIVHQLEKVRGNLYLFCKAVCRILKKFLPDNLPSEEKCPECGNNLIRKEGCLSCSCGFSKCS